MEIFADQLKLKGIKSPEEFSFCTGYYLMKSDIVPDTDPFGQAMGAPILHPVLEGIEAISEDRAEELRSTVDKITSKWPPLSRR